jgi:hypothetical protein
MKYGFVAASVALAVGVSACATGSGGYGGGGYGGGGTQISKCTRNALIGAVAGAAVGAATGSDQNQPENAALGGAAAGLGTFAVCRYLDNNQQARIEGAYANAAANNAPVGMNWIGTTGTAYVLSVQQPYPAARPGCRVLSATLQVGQQAPQSLPQELYCQAGNGAWVPSA